MGLLLEGWREDDAADLQMVAQVGQLGFDSGIDVLEIRPFSPVRIKGWWAACAGNELESCSASKLASISMDQQKMVVV